MNEEEKNKPQSVKLEEALALEKQKKQQADMKPLKTYQSDVAEAIRKDNVSVIKMALAEKKRQEKEEVAQEVFPTESKKGLLFFSLSVVLILLGLGIIGYFIFFHKAPEIPFVSAPTSKSLIYVEKNAEIKLEGNQPRIIIDSVKKFKESGVPKGTIENLIVTNISTATSSQLSRHSVSAPDFINLFRTRIPAGFFRSIQDPFIFGLYGGESDTQTVMLIKTDSYENAFAGMLDWEKNFQRDVGELFSIPTNLTATASSSVTSTSSTSTVTLQPSSGFSFLPKAFEDRVINNRDTRVLTNQNGKIIFLYSFADPNTLIFATDAESFREVLNRYIQTKKEK